MTNNDEEPSIRLLDEKGKQALEMKVTSAGLSQVGVQSGNNAAVVITADTFGTAKVGLIGKGKGLASLEYSESQGGRLGLYHDDYGWATLGLRSEHQQVCFPGTPKAEEHIGPILTLASEKLFPQLQLKVTKEGRCDITAIDNARRVRFGMRLHEDGLPQVSVFDEKGRSICEYGSLINASGYIRLIDNKGDIWKAP